MKTLSIIAIAGLASVAVADARLSANPNYAGHSGVVDRTQYVSAVYDFTFDDAHWDLQGSPNNTVFTLDLNALLGGIAGDDAFVTGLGWNVNLETVGASWLSEAVYNYSGQIFLTPAVGENAPGAGNFASGGILDLGDNGLPDILAAGGILTIELFESFDDVAGAIDTFADGTLTLAVDYKVPAPGALAVLGLGGLVASRRRR